MMPGPVTAGVGCAGGWEGGWLGSPGKRVVADWLGQMSGLGECSFDWVSSNVV